MLKKSAKEVANSMLLQSLKRQRNFHFPNQVWLEIILSYIETIALMKRFKKTKTKTKNSMEKKKKLKKIGVTKVYHKLKKRRR